MRLPFSGIKLNVEQEKKLMKRKTKRTNSGVNNVKVLQYFVQTA